MTSMYSSYIDTNKLYDNIYGGGKLMSRRGRGRGRGRERGREPVTGGGDTIRCYDKTTGEKTGNCDNEELLNEIESVIEKYDLLLKKKSDAGGVLSSEDEKELARLAPEVFTSIMMMVNGINDILKVTNIPMHRGGAGEPGAGEPAAVTPAAVEPVPVAIEPPNSLTSDKPPAANSNDAAVAPPTNSNDAVASNDASATSNDASAAKEDKTKEKDKPKEKEKTDEEKLDDDLEKRRILEMQALQRTLIPTIQSLLSILDEQKKRNEKKDDDVERDTYPDVGSSIVNTVTLAIQRIKDKFNELLNSGSANISDNVGLRKLIPEGELPGNPQEAQMIAEQAETKADGHLKNIEKVIAKDVQNIATAGADAVMNAFSLIPGVGTVLQLWRLLQNVIILLGGSLAGFNGAKGELQELQKDMQNMAPKVPDPAAMAASAAGAGAGGLAAAIPDPNKIAKNAMGGLADAATAGATDAAKNATVGLTNPMSSAIPPAIPTASAFTPPPLATGANTGGGGPKKNTRKHSNYMRMYTRRLKSPEEYKKEYVRAKHQINKTHRRIMKTLKNITGGMGVSL